MTCNTLGLVTQNDCKVYWPTRIKSELWHSRSMGIWAHPTYSICLLAIILLRISCLFSYYFWVISIPISVGFFSLPGMSFLFIHPSCPLSLKDVTHFYISYGTSYDNFSLQWFLHFVFLFHLIQHWVFTDACGPRPVAASGGCSLVAVRGLVDAVASLVGQALGCAGFIVAHGLSCLDSDGLA